MEAVETASAELQSEASLLFLPPYLAQHVGSWRAVGYRPQTIQALGVRAWQEAAVEFDAAWFVAVVQALARRSRPATDVAVGLPSDPHPPPLPLRPRTFAAAELGWNAW